VEPLLETRDIVAGYSEVPILRGVSFHLYPEELVAVIGPNGAGKSTLIKAVFGILKPLSGNVVYDGQDITGWPPERIVAAGISYVPQMNNAFRSLSVRENLEMGAYILNYGSSGWFGSFASGASDRLASLLGRPVRRFYPTKRLRGSEIESRVAGVIDLFPDLRQRLGDIVGNLSGGQQQMVALARALILQPKVLLIDEPSAGLAPKLVDAVLRQIAAINERGTAIVLVEQNARKALQLADRGYVLEAGQNRLTDLADRILANPEIGELFLGGAPRARGT